MSSLEKALQEIEERGTKLVEEYKALSDQLTSLTGSRIGHIDFEIGTVPRVCSEDANVDKVASSPASSEHCPHDSEQCSPGLDITDTPTPILDVQDHGLPLLHPVRDSSYTDDSDAYTVIEGPSSPVGHSEHPVSHTKRRRHRRRKRKSRETQLGETHTTTRSDSEPQTKIFKDSQVMSSVHPRFLSHQLVYLCDAREVTLATSAEPERIGPFAVTRRYPNGTIRVKDTRTRRDFSFYKKQVRKPP